MPSFVQGWEIWVIMIVTLTSIWRMRTDEQWMLFIFRIIISPPKISVQEFTDKIISGSHFKRQYTWHWTRRLPRCLRVTAASACGLPLNLTFVGLGFRQFNSRLTSTLTPYRCSKAILRRRLSRSWLFPSHLYFTIAWVLPQLSVEA